MADADLSRIVSLIMENPKLIEEIKGLAEKDEGDEAAAAPPTATESEEPASTYAQSESGAKIKRRELLSALKPYVSPERSRAIDSMISISEILDMMKTR